MLLFNFSVFKVWNHKYINLGLLMNHFLANVSGSFRVVLGLFSESKAIFFPCCKMQGKDQKQGLK